MAKTSENDVFRLPGFLSFWTAETVSSFGTQITTLALQVLVVTTLSGTASDVGLVNAARWLPYLLFGLFLGALIDRQRRKPILVATDFARAVALGAIPALWLLGWLTLPAVMAFAALLGALTLFNDAASQSFVPRLAPRAQLVAANARLDQGAAAAQTAGPALAGALVSLMSAPFALIVDAATYLFSAIAIARLKITEPKPPPAARGNLWREIGEGFAWGYRHPMLAPLALSTHGWFVFNAMLGAVFVPFALLELRLSAFDLGLALACAGAAGLAGALLSSRIGARLGAGGAVIACRALMPLALIPIALAPGADADKTLIIAALALGQALFGFALGAVNAHEMGYRQGVTPDALQGRINTTQRSINRAMIVLGAPLGGVLADTIGYRETIWIAVAGFVAVNVFLALSPFRNARHEDA